MILIHRYGYFTTINIQSLQNLFKCALISRDGVIEVDEVRAH